MTCHGTHPDVDFKTMPITINEEPTKDESADPLFDYLKGKTKGILGGNIKWNFTKFLVDRDGNVIDRFAPSTTLEQIDAKIAPLL